MITTRRITHLERALLLVLPLLVTSAILNQQTGAGMLLVGQVVSTVGAILTIVIAFLTFPRQNVVFLLVGSMIALRVARVFFPSIDLLTTFYTFASCGVAFAAGLVISVRAPERTARQLWWVSAICLPLMILQVLGVGEWTQVLRTDLHDAGYAIRTQYPTLFKQTGEVVLNVIQSRPAGIFPSNNLLSMVLLFVAAWHFALSKGRGSWWRDLVLLAAAVLSMAKIVFLALAVLLLWLVLTGGRARRWRAIRAAVMMAALLAVYIELFPGLFEYNLDWDRTVLNFQLRLNDLLYASGNRTLQDYAMSNLVDVKAQEAIFIEGQRESGYATIVRVLPLLALGGLLLLIPYIGGLRGLRRFAGHLVLLSTSTLLMLILAPMITSFLSGVLFWFLAAPALLPVLAARIAAVRQLVTGAAAPAPNVHPA